MEQEILDARAKLAARFANSNQIGGKGNQNLQSHSCILTLYPIGTQRRKKKHVNQQNVNEDKKLKSAIKKFGMTFTMLFLHHRYRSATPLRH
jgi:hypothetical protein